MTRKEICIKAAYARGEKMKATFLERFWHKVTVTTPDKCWNWTGSVNGDGYGQIKRNGIAVMCHRLAFELKIATIPEGMQACHHCDNPRCCNPSHIFVGTPLDNVNDCIAKGRRKYRHGNCHHNAKLTDDQVREIRRLANNPVIARSEIAATFKVHVGHINSIVTRRRRSEVE